MLLGNPPTSKLPNVSRAIQASTTTRAPFVRTAPLGCMIMISRQARSASPAPEGNTLDSGRPINKHWGTSLWRMQRSVWRALQDCTTIAKMQRSLRKRVLPAPPVDFLSPEECVPTVKQAVAHFQRLVVSPTQSYFAEQGRMQAHRKIWGRRRLWTSVRHSVIPLQSFCPGRHLPWLSPDPCATAVQTVRPASPHRRTRIARRHV